MTRLEELTKAREIFNKIMKDGVYTPEQIKEGYTLVFPSKDYPNGNQARREFIGFNQYMYESIIAELDDLFDIPDELPDQPEVVVQERSMINDDEVEIENQLEIDLKPNKKKKRVYKKKK